jgi:predicted acylesterase/phospholipase RssA
LPSRYRQRFSTLSSQSVARHLRAQRAGQPVNILALSGGGADGAFGAGALVGLTRSALRPQFSVVTGVSTGALIAPYAFLGPDWNDQLAEVYTSGRAEHLLHSRGLAVFFGSSVYGGTPLKQLVYRYATDALIEAVARDVDRTTVARGHDRCQHRRAGDMGLGIDRDDTGTGRPSQCPADDEFNGRLAVR